MNYYTGEDREKQEDVAEDDEEVNHLNYADVWKEFNGSPVKSPGKVKKSRTGLVYSIEEEDENLGDDFEATPWVPPSIEKAKEFKKNSVFRGGDVNINSINVVNAPDLGLGVSLYFQFAFIMAAAFFTMTFLALPSLVFFSSGKRIQEEDQDAFSLYQYTYGNIGYDPSSPTYQTDAACTSPSFAANTTCVKFGSTEISITDAASILTAFEFVQVVVFFLFFLYLRSSAFSTRMRNKDTSISDYTLMVRGFPPDTTDAQLVEHFSKLYALDKVDWRGRPPVEDCVPVHNCDNSGDSLYLGTWIAESIVHKKIGRFIAEFKDKQFLMQRLYRCRAEMKMFAENSTHTYGHNLPRFLRAEKKMLKAASTIDKLTESNMKKAGMKVISQGSDEENGAIAARTSRVIYKTIDADAVAAFVVFQYCESFARCFEDYDHYSSFPFNLVYPNELKFRGNRLIVEKAPEPDQIVWENLEIGLRAKVIRRTLTALVSVFFMILCFIIILQASIYKSSFSNDIPDSTLCNGLIPQIYSNLSRTIDPQSMILTRPLENQSLLDMQCQEVIPNSFYATYLIDGDIDRKVGTYDINACTTEAAANNGLAFGGICPQYKQEVFCPCVTTSSSTNCRSAQCSTIGEDSADCISFSAGIIGSCYCYEELNSIISQQGVVETLNRIDNLDSGECESFYVNYGLSVGLTYLSVFVTVIANIVLRKMLIFFSHKEFHASGDSEQGAVMSKIFLSNYFVQSVIVIIAYGTADNLPQFFKDFQIFNGPYKDFSSGWFGVLGFYFVTTFIISAFSPLAANLFMYFFGIPFTQWLHHTQARRKTSYRIVMQHDLNMLEVGPVFDATQNNAQLLALLFLAMTYGPGLPLLTPLMFAAFILYFNVDKLLLATYYQKPPQIGNEAIKVVVQYLPIAAMVRLAIAIWMYGNADILPDTVSDEVPGAYQENLNSLKSGWPSIFSTFRDRALRPNTFPLFILLAVIVGFYFVEKFWYQLPFYWIYRFNKILYRVFCTQHIYKTSGTKESLHPFEIQKRNDALRLETAPYTGDYFRYVKHKDEIPHTFYDMCTYNSLTNIDEREVEEGWELADQGDYVIKVKIFSTEMKMPDGTLKEKGTRKKTYEIVGDFQCNSYDVEKVPAYKIAIQGLREGMQSMMEFHNKMKEEHTLEKETEENYEAFVKKRKNSLVYDYEHKGKALRRSFEEQVADESIDQHIDSSIKSIASEMLEKKQGTDKVHPKKSDEEKASELDKVRLKKKNKPQKDPTLASAIARARKNIAVDNASNLEEAVVDNTDDINADNTKLTPLRPTASSDLIQKDSSSSHFTGGKPSANIQKPPQPKKDITFDENGYPTDYYENQEYYDNNYYYNEETGTYEFYDASQYYNYHQ